MPKKSQPSDDLRAKLAIIPFEQKKCSQPASSKIRELQKNKRAFVETKNGALFYFSKNGDGIFLNGLAYDEKEERITCRHLASHHQSSDRLGCCGRWFE